MNILDESINKYAPVLEEYIQKIDSKFTAHSLKEAGKYKEFTTALLHIYYFSSYLMENLDFKRKTNAKYYESFYGLLCKSSQELLAIKATLEAGCILDSAIILRCLFETFITLKLLHQKSPFQRARLYWNHAKISLYLNYSEKKSLYESNKISKDDFLANYSTDRIKQIKKDYNKVKKDYPRQYKWYGKLFPHEKRLNLKFICEHLGIIDQYITLYSALSISVHSDRLIDNLLVQNNKFTLAPRFSSLTVNIACLAISYHIKNLSIVLDFFKIKDRKSMIMFLDNIFLGLSAESKYLETDADLMRFNQILSDPKIGSLRYWNNIQRMCY